MSDRAVSASTEPCPLCREEHVLPPFSVRGASLADEVTVCSPCRAEHTGTVQLRLPLGAAPGEITKRLKDFRRDPDFAGAVQAGLSVWAKALQEGADAATGVLAALENRPDEERVAAEFMGAPLLGDCDFLADPERPGLKLTGLPPELARRIVETVPMAEGPPLSVELMAELLRQAKR